MHFPEEDTLHGIVLRDGQKGNATGIIGTTSAKHCPIPSLPLTTNCNPGKWMRSLDEEYPPSSFRQLYCRGPSFCNWNNANPTNSTTVFLAWFEPTRWVKRANPRWAGTIKAIKFRSLAASRLKYCKLSSTGTNQEAIYPWPDSLPVPSQTTTNLQRSINETTLNFGLIQTTPHLEYWIWKRFDGRHPIIFVQYLCMSYATKEHQIRLFWYRHLQLPPLLKPQVGTFSTRNLQIAIAIAIWHFRIFAFLQFAILA